MRSDQKEALASLQRMQKEYAQKLNESEEPAAPITSIGPGVTSKGLEDVLELEREALALTEVEEKPKIFQEFQFYEKYKVGEVIGGGGQAIVRQVWEKGVENPTEKAGKIFMPIPGELLKIFAKVEQEFKALHRLKEIEGIPAPIECGIASNGQYGGSKEIIIVTERAGEKSLEELLRERQLDINETEKLYEKSLTLLAKAHSKGVIHRDIKPANITIDLNDEEKLGQSYLIDFGISKLFEEITRATQFTAAMGTEGYSSPEQKAKIKAEYETDLYSLGMTLFNSTNHDEITPDLSLRLGAMLLEDPDKRKEAWILKQDGKDTSYELNQRYVKKNVELIESSFEKIAGYRIDKKVANISRPKLLDSEWSLPEMEATRLIEKYLREKTREETINDLEKALEKENFDGRDRKIIEQSITYLTEEREIEFIGKNIKWYNDNFPERKIFGYKRAIIGQAYDIFGKSVGDWDINQITDESFRNVVKRSGEEGLTAEELLGLIRVLKNNSQTKIEIDNKELKKRIKKFKKQGTVIDATEFERIKAVGKYYRKIEKADEDLRYQALVSLLQEQDKFYDEEFIVKGNFGKKMIHEYYDMEIALAGAIGGIVLPIIGAFYFDIIGNETISNYSVLAAFPGMAVGGVLGCFTPRTLNNVTKRITPNKFYGEIEIRHSPDKVHSALDELVELIPEGEMKNLLSKFNQIGEEADSKLTPYELIDKVKEEYEKTTHEQQEEFSRGLTMPGPQAKFLE